MNITIPREEFDVPSVGSEYFWKVVSASNPWVYSEGQVFSLGYPGTLLSFRTSGVSLEEVMKLGGRELMDALMVTLGLAEDRMEMWALNGNPFEEGDDT
ncbi:unnamed protein product, partial [Sphacelaria rigidula]